MRRYSFTVISSLIISLPLVLLITSWKLTSSGSQTDQLLFTAKASDLIGSSSLSPLSALSNYNLTPGGGCRCDCDSLLSTGPTDELTTQYSLGANSDSEEDESNDYDSNLSKSQPGLSSKLRRRQQASGASTQSTPEAPTIYIITPTYTRATQMPDLTRMAQTLMLIDNIFWIVVEDSNSLNKQVGELLNRTQIPHAHLLGPRPPTHKDKRSGRGVSNRLKALQYLREKYTGTKTEGVIYFGDDDNSYDIRIFEEMRYTMKVSVWPVGLIQKTGVSTPIINGTGHVVAFHDPFIERRRFAVDMAGFAANLQLFLSRPKASMPYKVGYEEDYFIRSLGVKMEDLEPKANNCTQVLVWHTKTVFVQAPNYQTLTRYAKHKSINLKPLYDSVLQT